MFVVDFIDYEELQCVDIYSIVLKQISRQYFLFVEIVFMEIKFTNRCLHIQLLIDMLIAIRIPLPETVHVLSYPGFLFIVMFLSEVFTAF